jgi:hypothetical protein
MCVPVSIVQRISKEVTYEQNHFKKKKEPAVRKTPLKITLSLSKLKLQGDMREREREREREC